MQILNNWWVRTHRLSRERIPAFKYRRYVPESQETPAAASMMTAALG